VPPPDDELGPAPPSPPPLLLLPLLVALLLPPPGPLLALLEPLPEVVLPELPDVLDAEPPLPSGKLRSGPVQPSAIRTTNVPGSELRAIPRR
jgi:hypothetical protein